MSNTFNLKRFLKYFTYDISNAEESYGLSLIIWGGFPIIAFVVIQLFSFLILRNGHTSCPEDVTNAFFFISYMGVILTFPAKVYGQVTDRRFGTNWILVPASTLEKTLSMVIIGCLVLPVCFLLLFLASANIISLIDSGSLNLSAYPIFNIGILNFTVVIFFLNWAENILFFTLGSLVFKKKKTAKTILCSFVLLFLILMLMMLIFGKTSFTNEALKAIFGRQDIEFWINFIINAIYIVTLSILSVCLFFRVKTIRY